MGINKANHEPGAAGEFVLIQPVGFAHSSFEEVSVYCPFEISGGYREEYLVRQGIN